MNAIETYSYDFIETLNSLDKLAPKDILGAYSVTFPAGMSKVPILELCAIFEKEPSFEDKVRLTRHCIIGKPVEIAYKGEVKQTVLLNDFNADFDVFPVFTEHPFALMLLIQTCFAAQLKNSLPPSINISAKKTAQVQTAPIV